MGVLAPTDRARIEKLLSVALATRPLPAPDGSLFFASNRDGQSQGFRQQAPGADPQHVFASETRMVPHAHTPLGLLVREDSGGNEIWQLGLISNGEYRLLTYDPKAIHQSVTLGPDQKRVGLGWNPGGQADMVLGELDLASGELTPWAEPGGFWVWGAWSPTGKEAAVTKVMGTPAESYILDRTGALTRLLPAALRVHPVDWTDEGILVATDVDRDFLGLALIDPQQPELVSRWVFMEDHDVVGAGLDRAGTKLAAVVNEGIYDSVRIMAMDREPVRVTLPPG